MSFLKPAPSKALVPIAKEEHVLVDNTEHNALKALVHEQLLKLLGPTLYAQNMSEIDLAQKVSDSLKTVLSQRGLALDSAERLSLTEEISNDVLGYGPLEPLLRDETVTEIMVNGFDMVYVERAGILSEAPVAFTSEEHLRRIIDRIVSKIGRRVDEASPMVDARLPDGSRVNAVIPPVTLKGSSLTIRKFAKEAFEIEDLISFGTLNADAGEFLSRCVMGKLNIVVSGSTSSGKSQPLTSKVLTPSGWAEMGTLKIGDKIIDPKGQESEITGVYPQGDKQTYRVTFEDGSFAESSLDHLWSVQSLQKWRATKNKPERRNEWHTVTLGEIKEWMEKYKQTFAVPLMDSSVDFFSIDEDLPVDPYLLGLLLGDGSIAATPSFGSSDPELIEAARERLPEGIVMNWYDRTGEACDWYHLTGSDVGSQTICGLAHCDRPFYGRTLCKYHYEQAARNGVLSDYPNMVTTNYLMQRLGAVGLTSSHNSYNKFVPDVYKLGSASTRLAVLQGLMDTDGWWEMSAVGFSSASQQLAQDVCDLARSLGCKAKMRTKRAFFMYKGERREGSLAHVVAITERPEFRVFRLARKLKEQPHGTKRYNRYQPFKKTIRSIELVRLPEPHQCISVSADSHLYVTDGYTVTHNTTTLNVLSGWIPENERIVTVEDIAELKLHQRHVVPMESRPANIEGAGTISIRDLVRNALRMRPDRIVVGEIRDGAALDMLQAMNTGHDGSITTLHSNGPRDTLSRLETMVMMSGMELPVRVIREQVASAIDLIVHQQRLRDGSRRITHITEVVGMEGDVITLQDIYSFDFKAGVDAHGRYVGSLRSTGIRPAFASRLADQGIVFAPTAFGGF